MAKVLTTGLKFDLFIVSICACWRAKHSLAWIFLTIPPVASLSGADASLTERPLEVIAMAAGDPQPAKPVSFQTVDKGIYSGVKERLQIVIREQSEWKDFWQRHASIKANQPPPPTINFGDQIVVAVFLGDKSTGGYEIAIISAERSNGVLTVSFSEKEPRPGAITTQAFTQPFHIVRVAIPRAEKVVFRRLP